jgi:uroporphyrinogen decarboxylase
VTSRERVTRAMQRLEIYRVPLDLGCGGVNSAIDELYSHFDTRAREEVWKAMDIDIRHVGPVYVGPEGKDFIGWDTETDTLFGGTEYMDIDYEGSGGIAGTYSDDLGHRPFRDFTSVEEIESYEWPSVDWFDFSTLPEQCEKRKEYALVLGGWRGPIHRLRRRFRTQRDLMLSPSMWRDFCKEPMKRIFGLGKKHNVYVFFHSCGAVSSILDDLVEIGLDVLYPVQPNAFGMDHRELKERHGDGLAFWGGIDVQHVLPFGTEEDVRKHVRERIEILGAGGGYILASAHNLLRAFPLENILAMYDEAMKTPV